MPTTPHGYGKLRIRYSAYGALHSFSVNLTSTQSPANFSDMEALASDLVQYVQPCQPGSVAYDGWDSLSDEGIVLHSGGFGEALTGTHASSGPAWRSNTLTFTGKATTLGTDGVAGNTRMVLHVYDAYQPVAGAHSRLHTADVDLGALATWLATNLACWADYDGVKCSVRPAVEQQFNAHTQKAEGA